LTTSNSRRGEEERALAMADAGNGEGSGAAESGRGGGDGNVNLNEAIQNMVAQTFSAEQLGQINPSTPEGMASLTAILGQAMQAGLAARTVLDEQTKKAAEQKRKKRAEKGADADPKALEKERRKEERDALRKKKQDQKKEEERKKLPFISLSKAGIPSELAYTGARGTVRHIVGTNFARGIEWSSVSKAEQKRVIAQVKDAFRNGGDLDTQWIADKISNSMSQARYHDRIKIRAYLKDLSVYRDLQRPLHFSEDIWKAFYESEVQLKARKLLGIAKEQAKRAVEAGKTGRELREVEAKVAECQKVVEEVGEPPSKFIQAAERVNKTPNFVHKLGQGGLPGLKSAFVSPSLPSKLLQAPPPSLQLEMCRLGFKNCSRDLELFL